MLTFLCEEKKYIKEFFKSKKPVKVKAVSWMALPQPLEAQEYASPFAQ